MPLRGAMHGSVVNAAGSGPAAPSVGAQGLTFEDTFSNVSALNSASLNVTGGSIVLAIVGMGALANMHAPTDSAGNAYSPLLPAHNYQFWSGSGQRLYAATGVTGSAGLVVQETMPDVNDEVTLSVVEVRGGTSITHASVAETADGSSVPTTPTVTTSGPAVLVSWCWGDGAEVHDSITPASPWTLIQALNHAQAAGGVLQVGCAVRTVSAAGTYSCAWTMSPYQGGVCYIVSVE